MVGPNSKGFGILPTKLATLSWPVKSLFVHCRRNRRGGVGFTLIELLVVIAIIAVLATIFIPSFRRAKDSTQFTVCKNNLHQIGIALSLYVNEFGEYPLGAIYDVASAENPTGISATWDQSLLQYAGCNSNIFDCPGLPTPFPSPSYSYNEWGTQIDDFAHASLGLGQFGSLNSPTPECCVVAPSDMLAIADGGWVPLGFGWPGYPHSRHNQRSNGEFCDGHVEFSRSEIVNGRWTPEGQADQAHAKRWNNDNQPHPETWPQP